MAVVLIESYSAGFFVQIFHKTVKRKYTHPMDEWWKTGLNSLFNKLQLS